MLTENNNPKVKLFAETILYFRNKTRT